MENTVIIALDFESSEKTLGFLDLFEDTSLYVKVGMELYYQTGAEMLREIKRRGHKIFLDLKLHDIPNTVERTMRILKNLDVDMTNVHAAGGLEMMKAARRGLGDSTLLLAVTQLTSTSEQAMQHDQNIQTTLEESVVRYAKLSLDAGCDGVVCSPLESSIIHDTTHRDFLCVTPGIRLADNKTQDQIRVTTPKLARKLGSNYIVVGRPITQAIDPVLAYKQVCEEWSHYE